MSAILIVADALEAMLSAGWSCLGAGLATEGKVDIADTVSAASSVGGYSSTEDALGAGKMTSVCMSVCLTDRMAWCT